MLDTCTCTSVTFATTLFILLSLSHCLLGIPTLIIVDENYKILSSNGRGLVSNDSEGEVSALKWFECNLGKALSGIGRQWVLLNSRNDNVTITRLV